MWCCNLLNVFVNNLLHCVANIDVNKLQTFINYKNNRTESNDYVLKITTNHTHFDLPIRYLQVILVYLQYVSTADTPV